MKIPRDSRGCVYTFATVGRSVADSFPRRRQLARIVYAPELIGWPGDRAGLFGIVGSCSLLGEARPKAVGTPRRTARRCRSSRPPRNLVGVVRIAGKVPRSSCPATPYPWRRSAVRPQLTRKRLEAFASPHRRSQHRRCTSGTLHRYGGHCRQPRRRPVWRSLPGTQGIGEAQSGLKSALFHDSARIAIAPSPFNALKQSSARG